MKKFKTVLSLALGAIVAFSAFACNKDGAGDKENGGGELELWSKQAYVKVLADKDYDAEFKDPLAFDITACRNEYEGAQIIISANGGDIGSYSVELCDLISDGGAKLEKSNISVYDQKYINVVSASKSDSAGLGEYPDALLPFDVAESYGENFVKSGKNQAVYIEAYIPEDTAAGEYKGSFTLDIDGEKHSVPAKITVVDYTVPYETHLQSNFAIQPDRIVVGEKGMTRELWDAYVDTLVEFRTAPQAVVAGVVSAGSDNSDVHIKEWIDRVRVLCNKEKTHLHSTMSTIVLPTARNGSGINTGVMNRRLCALTAASVADGIDYLSLVDTRCGFIDEPHLNGTHDLVNSICASFNATRDAYAENVKNGSALAGIKAYIKDTLKEETSDGEIESTYALMKDGLASSIHGLSNTVTSLKDSRLSDDVDTFCVTRKGTTNAKDRDYYASMERPQWWYNCGADKMGYKIDGKLLEERVLGWASFDYRFEGDVYWDAALYTKQTWDPVGRVNTEMAVDPYAEPARCATNNGDGFLLYPGKRYGLKKPVTSVRLHSIRDGREDYEILYCLEKAYAEHGCSARPVLGTLFKDLYKDHDLTENAENVFGRARKSLIELAIAAEKGVYVSEFSENGTNIAVEITCAGDVAPTEINGVAKEAESVYAAEIPLTANGNELSVKLSDGTDFSLDLGGKVEILKNITAASDISVIADAAVEDGDGGACVRLQRSDIGISSVSVALESGSLSKNDASVKVRLINPNEKHVYVSAYIAGSGGMAYAGDRVLYNGANVFEITMLSSLNWNNIRQLRNIQLSFSLADGENAEDYAPITVSYVAAAR